MPTYSLLLTSLFTVIALLLGTCTPMIAADEPVVPTPTPDYLDMTQGGTVQFAPGTAPEPSQLMIPLLMRAYRPQAPMLGVALEGYFDQAGLQQFLALNPHFGRRYREIEWRLVEPNEGEYHWEVLKGLEEELKTAAATAVTPILNVQMTPKWAQKVRGHACGPIATNKYDSFARLLEQLVRRYGSGTEYNVRYWQIGNEPDVDINIVPGDSVFGCWGDVNDAYYGGGIYGDMLKYVYPRIKAADPNAVVLMGGLLLECDPYTMTVPATCKNAERLKSGLFLEGILRAGAIDSFDMVDVHGYGLLDLSLPAKMTDQYAWSPAIGGTGLPEKVAFVRKLLAQYGQPDKPVITTEVALKCEENTPECQEVGAAFIPRVYADAYRLGLAGAIYWALISEFKYKGLLLPDLTPKQQYFAYRTLGNMLAEVEYVKSVTDYPGVSGEEFKRSTIDTLWILWSTDGTEQQITPPADFVRAYDKYGNVLQLTDGKLVVDWSPIYVERVIQNQ